MNDGNNTREKVKEHDPLLATLLMHTYGDGPWRYTHTMPRDWGGGTRCATACCMQTCWQTLTVCGGSGVVHSLKWHLDPCYAVLCWQRLCTEFFLVCIGKLKHSIKG